MCIGGKHTIMSPNTTTIYILIFNTKCAYIWGQRDVTKNNVRACVRACFVVLVVDNFDRAARTSPASFTRLKKLRGHALSPTFCYILGGRVNWEL